MVSSYKLRYFLALPFLLIACSTAPINDMELDDVLQVHDTGPDYSVAVPRVLTLQTALELVRLNPDLSASSHRTIAAEGNLRQVSNAPNPKLSLSTESVSLEKPAWDASVTKVMLSQEIELGGKRSARTRLARGKKYLAQAQHRQVLVRVRLEVILAFNNVLHVQENTKLLKAILEASEKLKQVADAKLEKGKMSRREFLQFDIAQSNARLTYENASAQLRPALASLAAAIGIEAGQFRVELCEGALGGEMTSERTDDILESLQERLHETNPDILNAAQKLNVAQRQHLLERAKRWPNLTAGLMMAHMEAKDENAVGASLSIPIPIWDSNHNAVSAAASRADAAKGELAQVQNQVMARFEFLKEQLLTANRSITTYDANIIPRAQESYDIAVAAFEAGRLSYVETLGPLISLLNARKAELDWRKKLSDTLARLKSLTDHKDK